MIRIRLLFSVLCVLLLACSARQEVPQQLTPEALYERAFAYLQARDWNDAITYFERFMIQYPTHPRVQEARYRLAEAYFGKREYLTAANEFARLASDYPAGPWADDSRFKVCESYYRLSPKPQLDQQYTRGAVDHCQSLVTYYPASEYVSRAQQIMTELRMKLAEKEFETGEFYYRNNAYDSAIIYYDATVRDYSDTPYAPRALLRLYETYQTLGYREEATATRERLLRDYPNSPEARSLQQQTAAQL